MIDKQLYPWRVCLDLNVSKDAKNLKINL
jgi:hypothetical protein